MADWMDRWLSGKADAGIVYTGDAKDDSPGRQLSDKVIDWTILARRIVVSVPVLAVGARWKEAHAFNSTLTMGRWLSA